MVIGSVYSGIGGLDLGLQRAGHTVAWQCEADPWRRKVLARHWPRLACRTDLRTLCGLADVDCLVGEAPAPDQHWLCWWRQAVEYMRPETATLHCSPSLWESEAYWQLLAALPEYRVDRRWLRYRAVLHGDSTTYWGAYRMQMVLTLTRNVEAAVKECPLTSGFIVAPGPGDWVETFDVPLVHPALYEQIRGFPPGWTCAKGCVEPCACDADQRRHALAEAVCPAVGEALSRTLQRVGVWRTEEVVHA